MYQVEFVTRRVQKEFAAFDQGNQKQIQKAIMELSENPKPVHLGFQAFCSNGKVKRIKLGRIRMFYQIDEKNQKRFGLANWTHGIALQIGLILKDGFEIPLK